jgi:uncharacterized repeat protein (TIGR03803 family)
MKSEVLSASPNHVSTLAPVTRFRRSWCACALALLFTLGLAVTASAQARQLTVLHTFTGGKDGASPIWGSLIKDAAGNLYGATPSGGDLTCNNGLGCGIVFKVDATGKQTVLYTFTGGADGSGPIGTLLRDAAGSLYGTTNAGGTGGSGTVFRLNTKGKKTVLYNFQGGADGDEPFGDLIRDAAGNLYGTTLYGGRDPLQICNSGSGCGIVFKVDTSGKETVLYSFKGEEDGGESIAGLVMDAAGNLYGTTQLGGDSSCAGGIGCGTVFKLDKNGNETVLYRFTGSTDGLQPGAAVIRDAAGNLYGTTLQGGDLGCALGNGFGCGTVFKVDGSGNETVLYKFNGAPNGANAAVIRDAAGNIWGTTINGGAFNAGTVFRVDPSGKKIILHSFTGGADGGSPYAGLLRDAAGNFYGMTNSGGDLTCNHGNGCGTVFKIAAVTQ